ncbi:hypothetical protein J6TS7_29180 [Paenibacillus dendritiformis]|uniref:hypothetical protein n=1 Tax=Paenibacillus TaxID=44249 RepID=UPI001B1332E0|nr:hypothetical protein [Paenibacillus dendritiformis]GIO79308.1 hypothetical protein J6TS7_29180 [Paenibacillus dendritiformis]
MENLDEILDQTRKQVKELKVLLREARKFISEDSEAKKAWHEKINVALAKEFR